MTDTTGSARFRKALTTEKDELRGVPEDTITEADACLCDQLDAMLALTTEGHPSSRLHAIQAVAKLATQLGDRVSYRRWCALDYRKRRK